MRIALLLIFYNSGRELNRLVSSIPRGSIDILIGVDGIYSFNYGKDGNLSGLSTDRSRDILLDFGKKKDIEVHIEDCVCETQAIKRNRYLLLCEQFNVDCGIVTDSDEYFFYYYPPDHHWDMFKKCFKNVVDPKHNIYSINALREDGSSYSAIPRIWNKPSEVRYFRNSHYCFVNIKNGEYEKYKDYPYMYTQQSKGVIPGLILKHDHTLRNDLQMKMRKDYQGYNMRYESLVQQNVSHENAHEIALKDPVTKIISKCECPRCYSL